MKAVLIFSLSFFISCGKKDKRPEIEEFPSYAILKNRYLEMVTEAQSKFDKKTGWPSAQDCDGTLWAGLAKAAGVGSVQLDLAEHGPGEIHRRPYTPCWRDGQDLGARSTVSRDMILGYMWGADKDALKRLYEYGKGRNWVMGSPWPQEAGRVLLTGNLIGLLSRMNCEYSGVCDNNRHIPAHYSKDSTDYVTHLTVLYILLNGRDIQTVSISSEEKQMLKWLVEVDPNNATFEAARAMYDSDSFEKAANMLLTSNYLPSYVRGHDNYRYVYWLFTAKVILSNYN